MSFKDLTTRIRTGVDNYKAGQAQKKADEAARQQAILAGQIAPIQVVVNLDQGEKAYTELSAKRFAIVDSVVTKTVGKSKKKGVVTRAVVGGVLLGPLGALGGAATAGSKSNATTTEEVVSAMKQIDSGTFILTNKRMIFLGQEIVSLPYKDVVAVSFNKTMSGQKISIKYHGMKKGEFYSVTGPVAKDTELYYKGITEKLLLNEPGQLA